MNRFRRHLQQRVFGLARTTQQVVRQPSSAPGIARRALVKLWRAKGGGVYGLGYAITFFVLEVQLIAGDLWSSADVSEWSSDAVVTGALGWFFRFSLESLGSMVQALIWPVFVLQALGGWGLLLLGAVFVVGERLLRPLMERYVPELADADEPAPAATDDRTH